jgi:RNA polymerase sigma-70 factor (ECF subfamily)
MIGRASGRVAEGRPAWTSTDPEVVSAAQGGCTRSFERLYQRMSGRVRRTATRILRDEHAAEDAVQDTFLAVLQGICALSDPGAFDGWVLRIARYKAISIARRRERLAPSSQVHEDDSDLGSAGACVVHRTGTAEPGPLTVLLLRSAYEGMPWILRDTLRLKYREGLSCEAIARRHRVSLSCVKTRLHRARRELYRALGRHRG